MTLPLDPNSLGQKLAEANSRTIDSGDATFMKMDKTGAWVFGADDLEAQDGSFWAVNPASFMEGYIAWGESEVLGEEMAPMTAAPILPANLPDIAGPKGWQKQIGFQMVCLNGDDAGTQVLFKTSSKGGIKAVRKLVDNVVNQITATPNKIVPKVSLKNDFYKHKQYGKIFTPVFEIVDWLDNNAGQAETDPVQESPEEVTPPTDEAPVRRRRPVAS